MALQILFIAVYLPLLLAYFFSETSGNFKRRAVNKIVLASLFLGMGWYWYLTGYPFDSFRLVFMLGLTFSFLGDVLLLWSFIKGGIFFNIGNYIFFAYELLLARRLGLRPWELWPALCVLLLTWGGVMSLARLKLVSLGHIKVFPEYLFSVSLHGSLGITLAFLRPSPQTTVMGVGLFLFMISDYFLGYHKFNLRKNWVLRCNSGTYFIGMMLAALSLSLPAS